MRRLNTPKCKAPERYCLDFPLHKSVREVAELIRRNVKMTVIREFHCVGQWLPRLFHPGTRKITFLTPRNPNLRKRGKKRKKLVTHRDYSSIADCRTKFPEVFTGVCINSPTRCNFSCVFILKFALYMLRTDTPFIIRSLRITVYAAACTYHAEILK